MKQCTIVKAPAAAPCPKCRRGRLQQISLHIGGHGNCPHVLCSAAGCGYQKRLVPVPTGGNAAKIRIEYHRMRRLPWQVIAAHYGPVRMGRAVAEKRGAA